MAISELKVEFTFAIDAPELEDSEKQNIAKRLMRQLRDLDIVERVERTEDLNPEEGSKPGFATLVGVLTAEVSFKNTKAFLKFLSDRLGDKPVKVKVKVGDREVDIEAKSQHELAMAKQAAEDLIATMIKNIDV